MILRRLRATSLREASVSARDLPWLAAAILAGGVAAPVLLMFALDRGSAAAISLLLNLEGVFTAVWAWFVAREHFVARIAWGMACIVGGAAALSWRSTDVVRIDAPAVLVAAAALGWAMLVQSLM